MSDSFSSKQLEQIFDEIVMQDTVQSETTEPTGIELTEIENENTKNDHLSPATHATNIETSETRKSSIVSCFDEECAFEEYVKTKDQYDALSTDDQLHIRKCHLSCLVIYSLFAFYVT